ncbi:MAG TPA: SDR family NAD(P)-dependent oxidoreductase, partial [Candidatus Limnocylindrales bacterium]|nr:SDR family NAD(P)-dependent oxidoreductase [Candidatus Limnocylindrales bacterium]
MGPTGTADPRVAVVTGATGKLGGVVAARFAEAGYRLALLARSQQELSNLASSLPGGADRHTGVAVDLGNASSTVEAAATVRERLGPVSGL